MHNQWVGVDHTMNIQRSPTMSFMSLCRVLGMLGILIPTLGIGSEGLESWIPLNGKDIASRPGIYSKCDRKVRERTSVVKVVKNDKGTVITVRSYVSEVSRDRFYLAKFESDLNILWQREVLCWHRHSPDPSEISGSGGSWGPV